MTTDDMLTAETLRRRDTTLSYVLDCLFDGVYIVDTRRQILYWNKGAEEITGYSAEEVVGTRCYASVLNHMNEEGVLMCKSHCPLVQTIQSGQHVSEKVYPLHKSGKRFPVMTHAAPIRDESGAIIAAIEVFRDITEQEELRLLQEKFQKLIRKYVSTQTFEEVMQQVQSNKEGQARIRDLTILYLDIVGFTTYSEHRPPEKIAQMLNHVFSICEVISRECHGDIDKFIGDAVMATFIDANDAIRASERILEALESLNIIRREEEEEEIKIRIGINSGNVIQGDIGTLERRDLTVIGDAVNTAARIQTIAHPNSIAISEATYLRLKDQSVFRFDQTVSVKGKKNPLSIFQYVQDLAAPTECPTQLDGKSNTEIEDKYSV